MSLSVSEIFHSIQGEGILTGQPSIFIRLSGCDLHCRWCDTQYALKKSQGRQMSIKEIIRDINKWDCSFIVITGGEPLLANHLDLLMENLKMLRKHITLETAATQYRPLRCDLASISPKLSNSTPKNSKPAQHEKKRLNIKAIQNFIDRHDYQLKFVVEQETDLAEIHKIIDQLKNVEQDRVLLMPQAQTRDQHETLAPKIAQLCLQHNFRYCPRLHIQLWNNKKGT